MATEKQLPKLAGTLVEHQSEFAVLSNEDTQWAILNPKEAIALACEAIRNRAKAIVAQLTSLATNVLVLATTGCKVKDLFRGVHISYRDEDLDRWLQKSVPATAEGHASSYRLDAEMNFVEMASAHLGIAKDIDLVAKSLIEQNKCFSHKQVDDLLVACERGENPLKLRTDSWANLFPVFDGASVFFLYAYRHSYGWHVYVYGLERSARWRVGDVVLFRN